MLVADVVDVFGGDSTSTLVRVVLTDVVMAEGRRENE